MGVAAVVDASVAIDCTFINGNILCVKLHIPIYQVEAYTMVYCK